jgi:hypothetical protein
MSSGILEKLDIRRAISIANRFCPYCAKEVFNTDCTKDHVIARKFVPEGTMADAFNIQFRCHSRCNGNKARLEDDISAITMMPDSDGNYARDDERLIRSSRRKAEGSISHATKRKVASSQSAIEIEYEHSIGAKLKFELTGSPYLDPLRVRQLAYLQMQGVHFFQTYSKQTRCGSYIPYSEFKVASFLPRNDWGNPVAIEFAKQLQQWEPLLHMVTADGYFCCQKRKLPDHDVWAWALEWNEAYRVFGFWGDTRKSAELIETIPEPEPTFWFGDKVNGLASREEIPLDPSQDFMFANPDGYDELPVAESPHWR